MINPYWKNFAIDMFCLAQSQLDHEKHKRLIEQGVVEFRPRAGKTKAVYVHGNYIMTLFKSNSRYMNRVLVESVFRTLDAVEEKQKYEKH